MVYWYRCCWWWTVEEDKMEEHKDSGRRCSNAHSCPVHNSAPLSNLLRRARGRHVRKELCCTQCILCLCCAVQSQFSPGLVMRRTLWTMLGGLMDASNYIPKDNCVLTCPISLSRTPSEPSVQVFLHVHMCILTRSQTCINVFYK